MKIFRLLMIFLVLVTTAESVAARAGGAGPTESESSAVSTSEPKERLEKDEPAVEGQGLFLLYVFGGIAGFFLIVALLVKIKNRKK